MEKEIDDIKFESVAESYEKGFADGMSVGKREQRAMAYEWMKARNVLTEASLEGFKKAMEE